MNNNNEKQKQKHTNTSGGTDLGMHANSVQTGVLHNINKPQEPKYSVSQPAHPTSADISNKHTNTSGGTDFRMHVNSAHNLLVHAFDVSRS